ncbi:hypothetical protein STRAU_3376 [Streptomyces aurantiacus JA 4570]|uniref:Uncharacterized protein n=1 Tax=Streptomyces aurantiacus JA 4570 TaxID=1286094 RepID=S4AQ20_9ACTN|nr:hypothetical protein STRAU_3376 [Streptomyces aurantiacus JA 4570]
MQLLHVHLGAGDFAQAVHEDVRPGPQPFAKLPAMTSRHVADIWSAESGNGGVAGSHAP